MTAICDDQSLICDREGVTFYLGTHHPPWLAEEPKGAPQNVCLFVSHRRLRELKRLPVAPLGRGYAIDSGAFTELKDFGRFRTSPQEYIDALIRYDTQIGDLAWAAPQDWMCEPAVIRGGRWGKEYFVGTGLSVEEHQRRTVANFVELERLWPRHGHGDCPVMPVIQGWTLADYLRCVQMYEDAGVRLAENYPTVGVGSVCRRQGTAEIAEIFRTLAEMDLPLHGFGVKLEGLARYGRWLSSADSMAWSYHFRRLPPVDGCIGKRGRGVKNCANCLHAALAWRDHVLEVIAGAKDTAEQLEIDLSDAA